MQLFFILTYVFAYLKISKYTLWYRFIFFKQNVHTELFLSHLIDLYTMAHTQVQQYLGVSNVNTTWKAEGYMFEKPCLIIFLLLMKNPMNNQYFCLNHTEPQIFQEMPNINLILELKGKRFLGKVISRLPTLHYWYKSPKILVLNEPID